MTAQDLLADAALAAKESLTRFLAGFDESTRTRQAENLPNHLMWCLGHIALYLNRTAEMIDGQPLPERDFISADGASGTDLRFDTESVAYDTRPADEPTVFPTLERGVEIFEAAFDRIVAALRAADTATLEKTVTWANTELPMRALVMRVLLHAAVHTGQIIDLRRALKLERVIRP